ncbi:MAG: hypothetical protein AAF732_12695 [Pseudomonadota bacterium]
MTNLNAEFGFYSAYKTAAITPSIGSWAHLYHSAPSDVRLRWARQLQGSLVIAFEMPPSLRSAFVECEIPFIDCMIHPVRFMDDIFLAMRSSLEEVNAFLASRALPRRRVHAAAGAVSALAYRKKWVPNEDPFSLFVGQMLVDRSMISNGRVQSPESLREAIVAALGTSGRLKFSDHPLQNSDKAFAIVSAHVKQIQRTSQNTYALLASPALERVITISSSVGTEAEFFGKKVSYAIGPSSPVLFARDDDDGASYWSIFNEFMAADFWRAVLGPVLPVTAPDHDGPLWRPGLLRSTLGVGWGYDQMFGAAHPPAKPIAQTLVPAAVSTPRKAKGFAKLKREVRRPLSQGWSLVWKLGTAFAHGWKTANSVRGIGLALKLVGSGVGGRPPIVVHPRSSGIRALIVLDVGFLSVKSGSRQVLEAQLCALRSNGYRIDFLLVHPARAPKQEPIDTKLLAQFPIEVAYEAGLDLALHHMPAASRWARPSRTPMQYSVGELIAASKAMVVSSELQAQIDKQPYDAVLVNYVWNLPLAVKLAAHRSPVIVETHDIQSKQIAYWRGADVLEKNLQQEISSLASADAVVALNSDEFEFFKSRIRPEAVHLLYPPAIIDAREAPGETLLERFRFSSNRWLPKSVWF